MGPATALLALALLAEPGDAGAAAPAAQADAGAAVSSDAGSDAALPAPAETVARPRRTFKGEKRAPALLLSYLRQQTLGDWCPRSNWGAPAPLSATRFLELRDGGLLFFAQVPNYLCNASNRAIPVVITAQGEWKWGAPIDGLVTHLARSEDGTLWVTTQWQVEGTYPALLRSRDGISWKEVELPEGRGTTGPMETLTSVCFGYQTVVVKLDSGDEEKPVAEVFRRPREGEGSWTREEQGVDGGCLPPLPASERWTRDDAQADRALFVKGTQVFSLPRLLRPR